MESLDMLPLRTIDRYRLRTILSVLAVTLGVATIVAGDVVSRSIINTLAESEDAQSFMLGLIEQLDGMLELAGVGIILAAGFMVFNAFTMSITRRRQQIGMLRSLGASRGQVMQLVLIEALVTGMVGALVGLILGPFLGYATIGTIQGLVGEDLFVFTVSGAAPLTLLLAAGMGVGTTLLAVFFPAWHAMRIPPLAALRTPEAAGIRRFPIRWTIVAAVVIVGMMVYLAVAPPGEWIQPPWDVPLTILFGLLWLGCLGGILPALVGGMGRWMRPPLSRLAGATGRLIADNLRRGRGRITLTVLSLGVALTMIVGMTGFLRFTWDELMGPKISMGLERGAWLIAPFDFTEGMAAYADMEQIQIPPDAIIQLREGLEGYGQVVAMYYVIVPELSFFGSSYFSFVADPHRLQERGDWFFEFIEGDWETALPIMEEGCGVLITPLIAGRNGVGLGDRFQVTGAEGPVECTVAGIGAPLVNASIIGIEAGDRFGITAPVSAGAWPLPGVDRGAFEARLTSLVDDIPGVKAAELERLFEMQSEVLDLLPVLFNGLLLLAIVVAALGVINTTVISISERQRELGLLRAVGATRRQARRVVVGEAALIGLAGGGFGLIAGAGIVLIIVVVYGGNSWGVTDLALWPAAWRSVQPALLNGLIGLILAPFVSAGAAWLPTRAILRDSTVEMFPLSS